MAQIENAKTPYEGVQEIMPNFETFVLKPYSLPLKLLTNNLTNSLAILKLALLASYLPKSTFQNFVVKTYQFAIEIVNDKHKVSHF